MGKNQNLGDFDEHILQTFIDESTELISQLEEQLLTLEDNRSDMNAINRVFRVMHTLKGNGAMFGFTDMSEFTHHLENIYDRIRNDQLTLNDDIFSITLMSLDHLKALLYSPESESTIAMHTQLMQQLDDLSIGKKIEKISPKLDIQEPQNQQHLFYVYFLPDEDILSDGTNPLFLVQDMCAIGESVTYCYTANIPDKEKFNIEKCYLIWHLLISTSRSQSDIEEVFMFVDEKSQPQIVDLGVFDVQIEEIAESFYVFAHNARKIESLDSLLDPFKQTKTEKLGDTKPEKNANSASASSLRVSVQKIDNLLNLVSELITVQAELNLLASLSTDDDLIESIERIESVSRGLRDNAFSISLMPIEQSLVRFKRLVRDVSEQLGKIVNFNVEGGETELDKTIIESIIDPIMHILRNSIDHGIESPEKRVAAGKPEAGTILFKAYCMGPYVVIDISDDGAGLNLRKIREIAIKRGVISESDILSDDDIRHLILAPGFSTADKVSEVSGRGVGMDVVHQKIKEVHGELHIYSHEGKGTTMSLHLPLTISIIDSLLIRLGSTRFLIPLTSVHQCLEIPYQQLETSKNKSIIFNEEYLPIIIMSDEFEIQPDFQKVVRVVVAKYGSQYVGLVVDKIEGQHQAVLKPLGLLYRQQEFISGASILGDGEVALVIDINMLIKHHLIRQKSIKKSLIKENV